jgi:hypothetical protein
MLSLMLAVLAIVPALARADGRAAVRIRDVRVGEHAGFARLVIELDNPAEVIWENGPAPGEESFYVAAAPAQASRVIVTDLPHVGIVSVTAMKGGAHVAIEPRARRVRAYTLTYPARLVVDFAPPAAEAFEAPVGTRALEPAATLGRLVLEPESEPVPEPAPALAPDPEPAPEPEPPAVETAPAPTPASELAAEPEPEAPLLEPPAPTAEPTGTSAALAPTPDTATLPEPAPASQSPTPPLSYGLALAALLGLVLLIAATVVFTRPRAARSESRFSVFPHHEEDAPAATGVDKISTAGMLAAGEHDGMLRKRLDEEVHARLELEQRFAHARAELKVLRDRLHWLERQREAAS